MDIGRSKVMRNQPIYLQTVVKTSNICTYQSSIQGIMFRSVKLIREVIGSRARPSLARPIIKQNAFLGAGTFNYAPSKLNVLKLSDDSLSFSVVRSATEKNTVPSRAALTLVSFTQRFRTSANCGPFRGGVNVG